MKRLMNEIAMRAQIAGQGNAMPRLGEVSGYNPANYCVKVKLQPEGVETGWIPLLSPWIGNGWGMFCPPTIGDMIEVQFRDGSIEAGMAGGRGYSNKNRPLAVTGGEFWLVHQSGSALKFHNDGSVEVVAAGNLTSTVGGNLTASVTGTGTASAASWTLNGNTQLNGNLVVSGDITDRNGTKGTLQHVRDNYDAHTHTNSAGVTTTPSNSL